MNTIFEQLVTRGRTWEAKWPNDRPDRDAATSLAVDDCTSPSHRVEEEPRREFDHECAPAIEVVNEQKINERPFRTFSSKLQK